MTAEEEWELLLIQALFGEDVTERRLEIINSLFEKIESIRDMSEAMTEELIPVFFTHPIHGKFFLKALRLAKWHLFTAARVLETEKQRKKKASEEPNRSDL